MQNLQEVFKRIQQHKKEVKTIKAIYNDALTSHQEYQEVLKLLQDLRLRKKKLETMIQEDFKAELDKLENLKLNITAENQLLSDISLASLVAGETVKIVDDYKIEYEPQFSVKFKKR